MFCFSAQFAGELRAVTEHDPGHEATNIIRKAEPLVTVSNSQKKFWRFNQSLIPAGMAEKFERPPLWVALSPVMV